MSKKKISIILVLITIIIATSLVVINAINQSKREYEIEQIEKYNYFVLKIGEKYGL